jgi:amino acid transporter
MLKRSLTLTDLTLFGIASIMGSGGFNLIGSSVREGGNMWPIALLVSGALLMCSSFTYAEAFDRFHKATSESDSIQESFGPIAESIGSFTIVFYNLASIIVILTICAQMILPNGSWAAQVSLAVSILAVMAALSLYGIDIDKFIITTLTWFLIGILVIASAFGVWGGITTQIPDLGSSGNIMKSFWKFFFVLVGFDAIMKFAEETEHDENIPTAFYLSNIISILLVAAVAFAITVWVPTSKQNMDVLSYLFALFAGAWVIYPFRWLIILFLLTTTFVVFLATTRYMYGIGDTFGDSYKWLRATNEQNAPWAAIATVFGSGSILAMLNNVDKLVIITDFGFAGIASLVAASVAVAEWKDEKLGSAALSGATALSFCGLTIAAFLSI